MASTETRTSKRPWHGRLDDDRYEVPWQKWTYGYNPASSSFSVLQQIWDIKRDGSRRPCEWIARGKPMNPSKLIEFSFDQVESIYGEAEKAGIVLKAAVYKAVNKKGITPEIEEAIALGPDIYVAVEEETPEAVQENASSALAKLREIAGTNTKTRKPAATAAINL